MQKKSEKIEISCDALVIGGGPAGMMSAIHASRGGANVVLVEKNPILGKKLRITGGGRCNITNATFDNRALAKKYGEKGKFLLSPFSQWNAKSTIEFFTSIGVPTKTEAEQRVFPQSDSAEYVTEALVQELKKVNVHIITKEPIIKLQTENKTIVSAKTSTHVIFAKTFIITTGGTARPETGSTGDGFAWLAKLGHTITTPESALVPITIKESWVPKLQGLTLSDTKITLLVDEKRIKSAIGKILFTHFGLSGPLILNMSRTIGEELKNSKTTLSLDLFPTLDHRELDKKLREHLESAQNKKWQNALSGFFPPLLYHMLVELSRIDPDMQVNKIPRESRLAFVKLLKNLLITPTGLLSQEKAIVSSGGVRLEEIDFKTMRSRKIHNLFLAGDILDFDRPSGGFSLQICWTTGFVAGKNAGVRARDILK